MVKSILQYLGGFKLKFAFVLLCAVITAAADLLMPYLSATFIDEILTSRDVGRFYFFIGGLLLLNVISLAATNGVAMHGDGSPALNRREVDNNFPRRGDDSRGDLLWATGEIICGVDGGARDRIKIFRELVG